LKVILTETLFEKL